MNSSVAFSTFTRCDRLLCLVSVCTRPKAIILLMAKLRSRETDFTKTTQWVWIQTLTFWLQRQCFPPALPCLWADLSVRKGPAVIYRHPVTQASSPFICYPVLCGEGCPADVPNSWGTQRREKPQRQWLWLRFIRGFLLIDFFFPLPGVNCYPRVPFSCVLWLPEGSVGCVI